MVRIKYTGPEFEIELPGSGPDEGVAISAMLLTGKVPSSNSASLIPPPSAQRLLSPPSAQKIVQLDDEPQAGELVIPSSEKTEVKISPQKKSAVLPVLAGGLFGLLTLFGAISLHQNGGLPSHFSEPEQTPSQPTEESAPVEPVPLDDMGVPVTPPRSELPPWPPNPEPGLKRNGD